MNCIFCKKNSDSSISKEHIIPESLGNKEHILPKGVVCDQCNSYFANKIENELLNQEYFRYVRSSQDIVSKKRKVIPTTGIILHELGGRVDIYKDSSGVSVDVSSTAILDLIKDGKVNKLYIPHHIEPFPVNLPLSRLLGKMAIEALAQKLLGIEGWESEVTYRQELEPLRAYVRYGAGRIKFWQYDQRYLYSPAHVFKDDSNEPYNVLHEYAFHYSEDKELFFIIVIFGIEYAINMSSPEIASYQNIIKNNNGKSFLY